MTASERDHQSVGTSLGSPRCHGPLADDEVPVTLAGLFCGHAVHDGAGMIKLDVPHIVERGVSALVSVVVNWQMVLANAVARLYLIADLNAVPLLAKITLLPDIVPPHLALEVRLEAATHLRALVQCGDGTVLQVKRWVWVMPPPGSADSVSEDVHQAGEPMPRSFTNMGLRHLGLPGQSEPV